SLYAAAWSIANAPANCARKKPRNSGEGSPSPRPSPPRRGRIVVRHLAIRRVPATKSARTALARNGKNYQANTHMLFPLPGGEGKGEGEPKLCSSFPSSFCTGEGSPSPRPSPPRRGGDDHHPLVVRTHPGT